MANKKFILGDMPVSVYKRRGNRSLRLTIGHEGEVRVSIPAWAPYRAGLDFARSRQEWISAQRVTVAPLREGQAVGKAHRLRFVVSSSSLRPRSRLKGNEIIVSYPSRLDISDPAVQKAAKDGAVRALRTQAEQLLPRRLAALAEAHGFSYSAVRIKQLKSRWGSCDQDGRIILNLFLMQLPWEQIDYVLLHELTHTRIMRHGPDFWKAMESVKPGVKVLRRQLRTQRPALHAPDGYPAADMT